MHYLNIASALSNHYIPEEDRIYSCANPGRSLFFRQTGWHNGNANRTWVLNTAVALGKLLPFIMISAANNPIGSTGRLRLTGLVLGP
jgi:hypothetical protein